MKKKTIEYVHALRHALHVRTRSRWLFLSHTFDRPCFMQIILVAFFRLCVRMLRSGSGVNVYLIAFAIYSELYAKQFFSVVFEARWASQRTNNESIKMVE